jgi:hypothetical protein
MLGPRNLQREKNCRTLKSPIIETVKIVYMFIYEFRLSQVPGTFDRLDSTPLSTGQDRPTRVWESCKKNLDTGCLGWMETYGMSPALSTEKINSTNQLAVA